MDDKTYTMPKGTDLGDSFTKDIDMGKVAKLTTKEGQLVGIDDPSPTQFSEDAMAVEFAQACGNQFCWSHGLGWMHFDGVRWQRDLKKRRFAAIRKIIRRNAQVTRELADKAKGSDKKPPIVQCKAATTTAVESLSVSDLAVDPDIWTASPDDLNTPGGIYNLRTGERRDCTPAAFQLHATTVAPDSRMLTPKWDRFLREVFIGADGTDHDMMQFIQRLLGYCLTGHRTEQIVAFMYGIGANGKSTLLDLIMHLMGDYAIAFPSSLLVQKKQLGHTTDLAQLQGVRLAVSNELERNEHWSEAMLKNLSGEATLRARLMRQDNLEFKQTQKHIIAGNYKPRCTGGDPAMQRRMKLLPFNAKFEGASRNPNLLDELIAEEAPGILAWMISGAVDWHRDGLKVPDAVNAASQEYMLDQDDLTMWLEACCVVDRNSREEPALLFESFKFWKTERNENAGSMKLWTEEMGKREEFKKKASNGRRYWTGVCLTDYERGNATTRRENAK